MDQTLDSAVAAIRDASRRLVRELGFMGAGLAGTGLHPSAVHALIEIGNAGALTAAELCDRLNLEKSSVSRLVARLVAAGELAEGTSARDGRVKPLSLTSRGEATLRGVDAFAREQVAAALDRLPPAARDRVRDGLSLYARALEARRREATPAPPAPTDLRIEAGYRPGALGGIVELHARHYAAQAGFGREFEALVAGGLAEFAGRLDRPANGLWTAAEGARILGSVAIDGEDLGGCAAHLRWFIMAEGYRGAGIGRRLLERAVAFCDEGGFAETQLWTFRGLDAARRLYESVGFVLVEERPGRQWGAEVMEQRFLRRRGGA